jgi:enoyl-CoA hydratase
MPKNSEQASNASAAAAVHIKVEGAIATVMLDRREVHNALTHDVLDEIDNAFIRLTDDSAVRVAILRGSGERAFASGMDLKHLRLMGPADTQEHFDQLNRVLKRIETTPFPVIAMVYGFAIGGGCELAAACDLRIAGSSARVGVPIGRFGHCTDRENLQRLLRLISPAHIKAMIMTDTLFDASDAHRMGFFNWVVPDASLEAFTLSMAKTISQKSPLGLRALKQAITEVLDGSTAHAANPNDDLVTSLWTTSDFQEGVAAFFERRTPQFQGK